MFEKLQRNWSSFLEKNRPAFRSIGRFFKNTGIVLKRTGIWLYRMRGLLLASPVAVSALSLALYNQNNLPEQVGIHLQASGEYAYMISRTAAIMGPLAVTALCILLMCCSRKIIYPWLISVFSLILPIMIYITNIFPG